MKPKYRAVLLDSVFIVFSTALPLCGQNLFWAAPVNQGGNRDGQWNLNTPSWAPFPGGPATSTWINNNNTIANFTNSEGGTATVTGTILLRGITSDTDTPVTITGGPLRLAAGSNIHVANSPLFINSAVTGLGAQVIKSGPGLLDLTRPLTSLSLVIQEGPVSFSGNYVNSGSQITNQATLILNADNTFSNYTQNSGVLTGNGILTTSLGAFLNSGSVAGHISGNTTIGGDVEVSGGIGTGILTVSAGTLTLTGTTTHSQIRILTGTSLIDVNGGFDAKQASLTNAGTLTLNADDTVYSYDQTGELAGSGRLTVEKAVFLDGGTVSGNLTGVVMNRGNVLVSGNIAGESLAIQSGILDLTGTTDHRSVVISAGAVLRASNPGLSALATVSNSGTLDVKANDTVSTYIQNGGILAGGGTLSATHGATLNSGTVSGSLSGNVTGNGNVLVSGTIGGGTLTLNQGVMTLNGRSTHGTVLIRNAGLELNSTGALAPAAQVTNDGGTLAVNADTTVARYAQVSGTVSGTGTLTATGGMSLQGGSIHGRLAGDISVSNTVGFFEDGELDHGVRIANTGRMVAHADETISAYSQTYGILDGKGTLTATGGAALHGGSILGHLVADTTTYGDVTVSGRISGDKLSVTGGELRITGSSGHAGIEIEAGASLVNEGSLNESAAVTNAGVYDGFNTSQVIGSFVNSGLVLGGPLIVNGPTVFNGGELFKTLIANGGATLNDGSSIRGDLSGPTATHGEVMVSGSLNAGVLQVVDGRLNLLGKSTNSLVVISGGAVLENSGNLGDASHIINSGTLTTDTDDTIGRLTHHGGMVNGTGKLNVIGAVVFNGGELAGKVIANGGATLNDGTRITGGLDANTSTFGSVAISGMAGGGNLRVKTGTLTLTGSIHSFTEVYEDAALRGTGVIHGDLSNHGALSADSSGDRTLKIKGSMATDGLVSLSLTNASAFDRIRVGGLAALDGNLLVTNAGDGLESGEVARIIKADSFTGAFETFTPVGFDNGVLFDERSGRLIGLAGGSSGSSRNYLNLNASQTQVYFSLYEDAVGIGSQNVTTGDGAETKRAQRAAKSAATGSTVEFTSGLSDGDPQLVDALNLATFTDPGSIFQPVINRLSPEVHRGMADYTMQSLGSHVRQGTETAPVSRSGRIQVFATAHTAMDGVESSLTDAGYDLQMNGFTSGLRYDLDKRTQLGGLLGADDGSIEGGLIDTDAQGLVVGAFVRHLADAKSRTTLTASLAYGGYDFDAERQSFQGPARAEDISSGAFKIAVGASAVAFEKHGLRVTPNATLRYIDGSVDGFTESGPGVPLKVGSQDIESVLLDLGVDVEYRILEQVTLAGNLGYVTGFGESPESIPGAFAASGTLGRPFGVSAPGIDDEAVVLGLGVHYDFNETMRASISYRADFRFDAEDAHSLGIGVSFGF